MLACRPRLAPLLCASAAAALLAASVEPSSCKSLESRNHLISRLTNELPEKRKTLILSERQIEQLVALLNAILDLDDFTDAEEQVIFRHAVSSVVQAVQNKLPRPFLQLLEHKGVGEGLGAEQAATLATRLQQVVQADVDLPYLNAKHEKQLTAAVVEMLVLSMRRDSSFEAALKIENAGPVVMQVFVKGNAGAFFSEREQIVTALADDLDVPLLPPSWKVSLCRRLVDVLAELLEGAIMRVYHSRRERVEATADANLAVALALAEAAKQRAASAKHAAAAAEAEAAAAGARASTAAEAEAAETQVPFDRRVRVALVAQLRERAPYLLATAKAVELAEHAVELALGDYFDGEQMNAAAAYLLDRHRLSRRLATMPDRSLELFLRKCARHGQSGRRMAPPQRPPTGCSYDCI